MSSSPPAFPRIAIVGVGLIGGSIALAARQRGVAREILGVGRSPARLQAACDKGVIDRACTLETLTDADLVIVCTPVDRIAHDVKDVLALTGPETLVTDAGSVKQAIIEELPQELRARFVGAHPIAGSHLTGFEHADARLYENRVCVLTPTSENSTQSVDRVREFWSALGMRMVTMSPQQHDEALARSSHLPHLMAFVTAAGVPVEELAFAAGGYRDTTRVAQGDPDLWTAIFALNSSAMQQEIALAMQRLQSLSAALQTDDRETLQKFLAEAQQRRLQYNAPSDGRNQE